jgi:hypothetical protein
MESAVSFLTRIFHASGNELVAKWKEPAAYILTRYNDGYLNFQMDVASGTGTGSLSHLRGKLYLGPVFLDCLLIILF